MNMTRAVLPAMRRAWSVFAAGLRDELTTDAQSRAREEPFAERQKGRHPGLERVLRDLDVFDVGEGVGHGSGWLLKGTSINPHFPALALHIA